ncbi:MAG: RNA polymerase sigma factor [Bacteroidales bacterium]|jgi:RNA polymerase sigma-70 factor (ECF subfamily)|nr:RNA polymerase sigma factor [Bacteroidales bacterium]
MSDEKKTRELQDPYSSLVAKCRKQDRRAQRELYEKLSMRMFPVCLRYMGERELARDVLHDGFITLFSKLSDYRGEGMFEGWARRIFVTACLMQLRKTDILKQAVQIDGESSKAEATLELDPEETAQMDADKLMEMIVSMPDGFRTVFNLYAIEGFSHKEISKMLNLSEGGCRSQLSRARAWLQERISKLNSSKEKAK